MVFLKKAHQRNLSILGIHKTGTKSANHDRHIHSKNIVQMNDTVSKKRSDQIMNSQRCHKLTSCEEYAEGGEL